MIPSFGETTAPGGRNARFGLVRCRLASVDDAEQIAVLHADSWRRYYRGAYADSFLDGDVVADRRSLWSARLAVPAYSETVLAEHDGRLVGFIHVVFDDDPGWGSLVDNLHVVHDLRRMGIGVRLLGRAARAVGERAIGDAMYLWVLRQNTAAQQFYRSCGATCVETAMVSPPGGDPARLNGTPRKLRMAWQGRRKAEPPPRRDRGRYADDVATGLDSAAGLTKMSAARLGPLPEVLRGPVSSCRRTRSTAAAAWFQDAWLADERVLIDAGGGASHRDALMDRFHVWEESMSRIFRRFAWPLLVATAAAGLIGAVVWRPVDTAAAGTASTTISASSMTPGVDGYLYGYAPVVAARTRTNQLCTIGIGVNTLVSSPVLGTPAGRGVVAPNVDTLYSLAWLDLRGGPVVLSIPSITDRYYGFEFIDMYTNVFANIGARTVGNDAGRYAIVPPGWTGRLPAGIRVQIAPTWDVWMLGRTLVKGPDDLTAARIVQAGYKLAVADIRRARGVKTTPAPPVLPADCAHLTSPQTPYDGGAAYFDELASVLAADPPPAADRRALAELARLGVLPGRTPSQGDPQTVAALQTAVTDGQVYLVQNAGSAFLAAGATWSSSLNIGTYGTNYLLRASTAMTGLAANVPAESTYYFSTLDTGGQPLTGGRTYRLRFSAGALPATGPVGFWSLTMYDEDYFLVPNTLNRYALGDRSSLAVNPDGSLDLYLSATSPAGVESNWLPAPDGPFHVYLRIYDPTDAVLDGTWLPPSITPLT